MSEQDQLCGRLLVVDDNEMNRDLLSRRLQRRGHEVVVAEDGRRALDIVAAEPVDLVLLDVTMPVLDGFETLSILRETRTETDLPVIMVTARDQSEDVVNALKRGANDYVTKPLDFPVVAARVQTQLSIKRMVDRIKELEQNVSQRNAMLEDANKRMTRDLEAAARIQQAGLPTELPQTPGVKFAWAYHPCDQLGGDSLNVIKLDDRHVGLYVLDVSGHGVPAALLSVTLNRELTPRPGSIMTESSAEPPGYRVTTPAKLAGKLNGIYPMDMNTRQYFTVVYAVYDVKERRFRFAGAGHPGPVIVNGADSPMIRDCPGYPIGVVPEAEFDELAIDLNPGDRIYMYSDGILEETNGVGEQFGRKRLIDCIRDASKLPLDESVNTLLQRVRAWPPNGEVRDDLSILAMEVGDAGAPPFDPKI